MQGDLKSLLPIWEAVVRFVSHKANVHVVELSLNRVRARSRIEGNAVFTTVLPRYGKFLLGALDDNPIVPIGIKRSPRGNYPLLFQELFSLILDENGFPRTDVRCEYIGIVSKAIMQICMFAYKIRANSSEDAELRAWQAFCQRNAANAAKVIPVDGRFAQARHVVSTVLRHCDLSAITPRHSGGTVAERSIRASYAAKTHENVNWPSDLEEYYPFSEYGVLSINHLMDEQLEPAEDSLPARVTFVPKDSRGPRMICMEPAARQFIQQGQMRALMQAMNERITLYGRTIDLSVQMPLRDREVNRALAKVGSITGDWCTIDLSDASDTISTKLVASLFPSNVYQYLSASRSKVAEYPITREYSETVALHTFAPMGASICFPVETLVFWAIAVACTRNPMNVFAFGDDIICRREDFDTICQTYSDFGFIVNRNKSFKHGLFRESCGFDGYAGVETTPVYLRSQPNAAGTSRFSLLAFYNNIVQRWETSADDSCGYTLLRDLHLDFCPRTAYAENTNCAVLSDHTALNDVFFKSRYNSNLQRHEHHCNVVTVRGAEPLPFDSWGEVFGSILSIVDGGDSLLTQRESRVSDASDAWTCVKKRWIEL